MDGDSVTRKAGISQKAPVAMAVSTPAATTMTAARATVRTRSPRRGTTGPVLRPGELVSLMVHYHARPHYR